MSDFGRRESAPIKEPTAFTRDFAFGYDTWSGVGRGYETFATLMSKRLLEVMPGARVVLEIGAGTGNSATVLLEQAPHVEVFATEPEDLIDLAHAKKRNAVGDFFGNQPIPEYSQEIAERLQPHKERLHLKRAQAERLPYEKNSMDAIFMCQVFHWLKPDEALKEMRRVLKPGGVVVFSESAAEFVFKDKTLNERALQYHPFARLFRKNLAQELKKLGHTMPIDDAGRLFTYKNLKKLFKKYGFDMVPTEKGELYAAATTTVTAEQVMVHESLTRMRIMKKMPELLRDPGPVDRMIAEVMHKTLAEWEQNPIDDGKEYGSTGAVFVARKTR